MSYSFNQRKKTIRRFKKKYGPKAWYSKFREYVADLIKQRDGPAITLEELMAHQKKVSTP